jgi:hypothetical protein
MLLLRRVPHPNVVPFDVRVGTLTLLCAVLKPPPTGWPTPRREMRPGAPHLALFEMWASEASHTSQPAVILRKRRPSQREGLPTKDLCTLQVPIKNPSRCHPEQSEGSADGWPILTSCFSTLGWGL